MGQERSISCPIWGTPATVLLEDHGRRWTYVSPRAGGKFVSVCDLESWGTGLSNSSKAKLTTWILEQNNVGEVPLVDSRRLAEVKTAPRISPSGRADRLLQFIATCQEHLGDYVRFADAQEALMLALAWSEATDAAELRFLFKSLGNSGLIQEHVTSSGRDVTLTLAGYGRLAEIVVSNQTSSQAFIAMWFDGAIQDAYDIGIEPAVRASGFKPLRIDRKETIGKIDDEIVAEIRRSRFLIADFTSEPDKPRGGVYFEAGFAMGLNIPVIWTCRGDLIDQVHFDTRQFSHIVWRDAQELRTKLINRIGAVIGRGPFLDA